MGSVHPEHRFFAEILKSAIDKYPPGPRRGPRDRTHLSDLRNVPILRNADGFYSHRFLGQYSFPNVREPAAGENSVLNLIISALADQITIRKLAGVSGEFAQHGEGVTGKSTFEHVAPQSLSSAAMSKGSAV